MSPKWMIGSFFAALALCAREVLSRVVLRALSEVLRASLVRGSGSVGPGEVQ